LKNKILFFIFVASFSVAAWVYASHPWLGKTLTANQVKQRWGSESFNEAKFKQANLNHRAKMAYSLLTSKKFQGLGAAEIREQLGDFDGHYFSESYPTYLIQIAERKGDESWQIVFLIDNDRKTKDVIVHKNCCD